MHTPHSCHCHKYDVYKDLPYGYTYAHCYHHHVLPKEEKLLIVTLLNALITALEIVGGLFSNSLSLLSDALHNLGDTLAIAFAMLPDASATSKRACAIPSVISMRKSWLLLLMLLY